MKLHVLLDAKIAGSLEWAGGACSFTYSQEWLSLKGAYPLSLSLPLSPQVYTGKSIAYYLWGLLPDNEIALQRMAYEFKVKARNPVALLSHVGEDCAGAVQFVREDRLEAVLTGKQNLTDVQWLTEDDIASRMRNLLNDVGAARKTTQEGQVCLSGAQAKTAFLYDGTTNRWGIPNGCTPTSHIFKPSRNSFDRFAENEHFCLELARRAAIPAAHSQWHSFGGISTIVVERYDRVLSQGLWSRVHQEDCCQALGMNPLHKYENEGGPGFKQIMGLLEKSAEPETDRARLMMSACFMYLLAAIDAHAKNYSLTYAHGAQGFNLRLSPLYDVASVWPYLQKLQLQKVKLAMRVGRHYRLREIQLRYFLELAQTCGFSKEAMLEILKYQTEALPILAAELLETIQLPHQVNPLARLVERLTIQCGATARVIENSL